MLSDKQFKELKKAVRAEMKKTVNGKIDELLKTVVTKEDFKKHEAKIAPLLEIYNTTSSTKRFVMATAKFVFWLSALVIAVKTILPF